MAIDLTSELIQFRDFLNAILAKGEVTVTAQQALDEFVATRDTQTESVDRAAMREALAEMNERAKAR